MPKPGEIESLAAHLPVGVVLLRPDGEITWANRRAHDILGGNVAMIVRHVADAFAGRPIHGARAAIPVGRRKIVVELSAASLEGRDGEVAVVIDDVTPRDRLERADAEFVQNAAHQLRNPVAAIVSSVAALNAGAREDPVERGRFIDHIGRESDRLATLVDALLALAALQRGDWLPETRVVTLRPLLQAAAATAAPHPARIGIDCADDIAVVSDAGLLTQALENVISNAAEHARSEVLIEAQIVDALAVVDVRDDGPGVPPAAADRVFERFFRADESGRRGSGLGLAIASAAAEAAHGTLALLPPEPGRGAVFRFTVPAARLL